MIQLPMADDRMDATEERIARGFDHCHTQLGKFSEQLLITASQLGAVINVLHARGLATEEELKAQYGVVASSFSALYQERQMNVAIDQATEDKYAIPPDRLPVIDCRERYSLCRAACCALRFPLSRQDLEEGVMRWEFDRPYTNRVGSDGYCTHLGRETLRCGIYEQRPGICRKYSCRNDTRIWLDFERRIINPRLVVSHDDGTYHFHFERPPEQPAAATEALPVAE